MARGKIKKVLEDRKAEKLLKDLRPSAAAYRKYRRQADGFLRAYGGPISASTYPGKCVTALRMHRSIIFGREYLIAHTNPNWFQQSIPNTNAFATPGIALGAILSPPLVFVPETMVKAAGQVFPSILEHEFVHLNQIILGTFPDSPRGTADDLLEWLFNATRAEYEANLLQLLHWPRLFASTYTNLGFSREAWCVFRGYTQGLELITAAVVGKHIEKSEFARFLGRLADAIPAGFRRMGFDADMARYCAARVTHHATIAVEVANERAMKAPAPRNTFDEVLGPLIRRWSEQEESLPPF